MPSSVWTRSARAILLAGSVSLGCGGGPPARRPPVVVRMNVQPLSLDGAGSTLALAIVGARRIAFVADTDDARIHAFDIDQRVELSATVLHGTPAQIVITHDGSLFVALRDRALVARYRIRDATGALDLDTEMATAAEPIALALSGGDRTLMVASGWGAELAVYDARSGALGARTALSREPRAVVVTRDGRAVVAHAVDDPLTIVTFEDGAPHARAARTDAPARHAGQGFALASVGGRVYAPQVMAEPELAATYYGGPTMRPFVAVVDESARPDVEAAPKLSNDEMGRPIRPVAMPAFRVARFAPVAVHCLLPRAAAVRIAPEPRLLVACMGDDVLLEYTSDKPEPTSLAWKRRPLPGGVTGLVVDAKTDTAIAWGQYARELVFVPLADETPTVTRIAASGPSRLDDEIALGRRIFHGASDTRLSSDGRACASCHPDGREDGRTWTTPDGPRQTMMLAGRLSDTAPYGWSRQSATLQQYFGDTISRLRGSGLPEGDAAALEKYLLSLAVPVAAMRTDAPLVAEGRAIFGSREAGCASCHVGGATTDGVRHDVGTGANASDELGTPSLRFVGKTAPYFHDGRYPTLRALLTATDARMGATKHLAPREIDALTAYLETL